MRIYSDNTPIPENLPQSYKPTTSNDVPEGQSCKNCKHFKLGYCKLWSAPVRSNYWCSFWKQ